MRKWIAGLLLCLCLLVSQALAEPAEDLTEQCLITSPGKGTEAVHDGLYTSFWRNREMKNGYLEFETPAGKSARWLYICFAEEPPYWEIQVMRDGEWVTKIIGEMRYAHTLLDLGSETHFRLIDTSGRKAQFKINEVYVFGDGEVPEWVQKWQPTQEKADILLIAAHPDDELLFFGGTIPDYGVERNMSVIVTYMSYSNTTRKSELLNGLWSMGVRNYPIIGSFTDNYRSTLEEGYRLWKQKDVDEFLTGIIRRYRPEVVLSHDVDGEYGHAAHKVCADAALRCSVKAGDETFCPDSATNFGTWQVKKVYLHLAKQQPIFMNWRTPLASQNGRTGLEAADDAYKLHVTQATTHFVVTDEGKNSCAEFGLVYSIVGPDVQGGDFLENIEEITGNLWRTEQETDDGADVDPSTDVLTEMPAVEPGQAGKIMTVPEVESASETSESEMKGLTFLPAGSDTVTEDPSEAETAGQDETGAETPSDAETAGQGESGAITPSEAETASQGETGEETPSEAETAGLDVSGAETPSDLETTGQDETGTPDSNEEEAGSAGEPVEEPADTETETDQGQLFVISVTGTVDQEEKTTGKAGKKPGTLIRASDSGEVSEIRKPAVDIAWPDALANVERDELGYAASGEWVIEDMDNGLWFYATPTLVVRVDRLFDPAKVLTWYEAHVYCDLDREHFGSILYDPDKPQNKHVQAKLIAKENQVVFGMNTDYYTYRLGRKTMIGMVIRNGRVFFDRVPEANRRQFPNLDTLAMYEDGHWAVFHSDELTAAEYIYAGAVDVWSFGPYLVRGGEINPFIAQMTNGKTEQPRCAIGMIEPGHYFAILAEGRIRNASVGVDIQFLADHTLAAGCQEALNLDGGQTAVMCFMGKQITRIGSYNGGNTSPRATTELMGIGHSDLIDPNAK